MNVFDVMSAMRRWSSEPMTDQRCVAIIGELQHTVVTAVGGSRNPKLAPFTNTKRVATLSPTQVTVVLPDSCAGIIPSGITLNGELVPVVTEDQIAALQDNPLYYRAAVLRGNEVEFPYARVLFSQAPNSAVSVEVSYLRSLNELFYLDGIEVYDTGRKIRQKMLSMDIWKVHWPSGIVLDSDRVSGGTMRQITSKAQAADHSIYQVVSSTEVGVYIGPQQVPVDFPSFKLVGNVEGKRLYPAVIVHMGLPDVLRAAIVMCFRRDYLKDRMAAAELERIIARFQ